MLKIKAWAMLALVSCIITPSFCLKAESSDLKEVIVSPPIPDELATQTLRCRGFGGTDNRKKNRSLELSDFKGEWIVSAQSIGGLAGRDKIGNVQAITAQMTIDKDGRGIINQGVITRYQGVPGQTDNTLKAKVYDLEITIVDADKGVVILNFDGPLPDPIVKSNSTYFAVINRSKKTGKVLEITGQRTKREPATETHLLTLKMNRQYGTF
ncbi:MAG: hypothetical protein ACH350_02560 [Parachlamydiaceae bacterium]